MLFFIIYLQHCFITVSPLSSEFMESYKSTLQFLDSRIYLNCICHRYSFYKLNDAEV